MAQALISVFTFKHVLFFFLFQFSSAISLFLLFVLFSRTFFTFVFNSLKRKQSLRLGELLGRSFWLSASDTGILKVGGGKRKLKEKGRRIRKRKE